MPKESESYPRGGAIQKMQKALEHRTYNGVEAAKEFGVSRVTILKRRRKFGFPQLLREEHMEILREDFDKRYDARRKQQKSMARTFQRFGRKKRSK